MNVAILWAALVGFQQANAPSPPPIRLKAGDKLLIETPVKGYGGEYVVATDGAIYGRGFDRLVVGNRTYNQVLADVRRAFLGLIAPDRVSVTLVSQRPEYVFVLGGGKTDGQIAFSPGLTFRQAVSAAVPTDRPETFDVQLFRAGRSIRRVNLYRMLSASAEPDSPLQANDVVSFVPQAALQVWVTGQVNRPGRVQIPVGSDPYQAIAAAGGLLTLPGDDRAREDESVVVVQRGGVRTEYPARAGRPLPNLEPGDTVSVLGPETRRISVAGEVLRPGEFVTKGATSIVAMVAQAGGLTADGSLRRVIVLRGGEVFQIDASGPVIGAPPSAFALLGGDVVFVRRNEDAFYVLGQVARPGKVLMQDRKQYTAADALAAAGGLDGRGVLRRVYLARPDSTGKVVIQKFNLDEYFKDGKVASNPILLPGDAVLFSATDNLSISAVSAQLSGLLIIDTLLRSR